MAGFLGFVDRLAVGFGVGHFPRIPGTAASLVGFLFFWPLRHLGAPFWWPMLAVLFGLGVYGAQRHETASGQKDPSCVVVDELCGVLFALLLAPHSTAMAWLGLGLFRFFDIAKPPPIRRLEALPGGWGIMLDDLAAAVYTVAILHLCDGWMTEPRPFF